MLLNLLLLSFESSWDLQNIFVDSLSLNPTAQCDETAQVGDHVPETKAL